MRDQITPPNGAVAHLAVLSAGHVRHGTACLHRLLERERGLLTCSLFEPRRGSVESAGLSLPWGLSRAATEMLLLSVSPTESKVTGCPCLHLFCGAGSREQLPYSALPWTHVLNV